MKIARQASQNHHHNTGTSADAEMNRVGIMGGDEDAPASHTPPKPSYYPEPTGEVIDQTINEIPEKRSTPPDYKPDTTPPESKP